MDDNAPYNIVPLGAGLGEESGRAFDLADTDFYKREIPLILERLGFPPCPLEYGGTLDRPHLCWRCFYLQIALNLAGGPMMAYRMLTARLDTEDRAVLLARQTAYYTEALAWATPITLPNDLRRMAPTDPYRADRARAEKLSRGKETN